MGTIGRKPAHSSFLKSSFIDLDKEKGPGAAFSSENNPQKLARGMLAKTESTGAMEIYPLLKSVRCAKINRPQLQGFESRTGSMLFLSTAVLGPCNFCPAKISSNK